MTRGQALLGVVCLFGGASCWSEQARIDDTFTEDEWAFLQTFEPPGPELCPPQFAATSLDRCIAAAEFGKALFFDKTMSGPIDYSADPSLANDPSALGAAGEDDKVACADCHDPAHFFIDTRSAPGNLSFGAKGPTKHNAMSPVNVSLKAVVARANCEQPDADPFECGLVFSWTGKYTTAAEVLKIAGPKAMNSNGEEIANAIHNNGSYFMSYAGLFGSFPPSCIKVPMIGTYECTCDSMPCDTPAEVFTNISLVLEAYIRQLNSVGSPFDNYLRSPIVDGRTAPVEHFGDAERRGLAVFIGKGMCVDCHRGPLLSDLKFHNTGVAQLGANVSPIDGGYGDEVFGDLAVPDSRLGEFLTPPLRHVAETGPYMHAGQYATLTEVIEFYRRGGDRQGFSGIKDGRIQPLEITDDEARDLEAFLRSLTGRPVDSAWIPETP